MVLNINLNTNNNAQYKENTRHAEIGGFVGRAVNVVQENPLPFLAAAIIILNLGFQAYESFRFSKMKMKAEPSRDMQKISNASQEESLVVGKSQEKAKIKINLIYKELDKNLLPPTDLPPLAPSLTKILKDNYQVYQNKTGTSTDVNQEDDWDTNVEPPKDLPPVAPSISQILKDNYQNYMKNTNNPISHNDW